MSPEDRDFLKEQFEMLRNAVVARRSPWAGIKTAAQHAAVSEDTIKGMLSSGRLQAYRPCPGRVVVNLDELDDLIRSSTATPRHRRGTYSRASQN
ncbi:hypothetical protein K2Y11_22465 [bacterium]|nr:hypothetical protein [bacterium]